MSAKKVVKSIAKMQGCYNLPTKDGKGRRQSLILARGDVSRPLTQEEFQIPEIQKGLKARDLLDWTNKV